MTRAVRLWQVWTGNDPAASDTFCATKAADVLFEPGGGLDSEEHVRWERAIDALHVLQAAAKLPG